jgi:hypothetical protein
MEFVCKSYGQLKFAHKNSPKQRDSVADKISNIILFYFTSELGAAWGGWFGPTSPPLLFFISGGTGNETLSRGKGCGGGNDRVKVPDLSMRR